MAEILHKYQNFDDLRKSRQRLLSLTLSSHSWVCLSLAYKYGGVTAGMTTLPHWKRSRIALGLMYSILGSIFSTLYYCGTPCHGLRFFSADYIHTF